MLKRPNHNAFTMIELLAATALSAVLMLAVLGLTVSMNRTEAALQRVATLSPNHARLIQLIRRDLAHARTLHVEQNDVVITGYSAFDPTTLQTNHRPVQIRYGVRANDDSSCLVRTQLFLDNPGDQKTSVQLVHWGVRSFALQRREEDDENAVRTIQTEEAQEDDEVPRQVVFTVMSADPDTADLEQIIVIR